jgi:hypothetical protein
VTWGLRSGWRCRNGVGVCTPAERVSEASPTADFAYGSGVGEPRAMSRRVSNQMHVMHGRIVRPRGGGSLAPMGASRSAQSRKPRHHHRHRATPRGRLPSVLARARAPWRITCRRAWAPSAAAGRWAAAARVRCRACTAAAGRGAAGRDRRSSSRPGWCRRGRPRSPPQRT